LCPPFFLCLLSFPMSDTVSIPINGLNVPYMRCGQCNKRFRATNLVVHSIEEKCCHEAPGALHSIDHWRVVMKVSRKVSRGAFKTFPIWDFTTDSEGDYVRFHIHDADIETFKHWFQNGMFPWHAEHYEPFNEVPVGLNYSFPALLDNYLRGFVIKWTQKWCPNALDNIVLPSIARLIKLNESSVSWVKNSHNIAWQQLTEQRRDAMDALLALSVEALDAIVNDNAPIPAPAPAEDAAEQEPDEPAAPAGGAGDAAVPQETDEDPI
jgi:hypothetical protein